MKLINEDQYMEEKEYKSILAMQIQQGEILRKHDDDIGDHESRIRTIEKFVAYGCGGLGLISFLYQNVKPLFH